MKLTGTNYIRRTTIIIIGLIAFLAGLGLARTKLTVHPAWILLSLTFVIVTIRRNRLAAAVCLAIFGLSLGLWRGSLYMQQLGKYQPYYNQKVTLRGTAETDGVYGKGSQLSFDLKNIEVIEPKEDQLVGKVSVRGFGANAIYRSDKVEASGRLYKTRGGRQASISYSQIRVIGRSISTVEKMRLNFQAGMLNALPEPAASFALGLLVGQRSTLPEQVNEQLSTAGLTHIVAVSGYNLTIIILAVSYVLKGRSKYQATAVSVALIILFLLFTGFSASIVRAAIVSGLAITAGYYGRKFRPLLLILLAAALTAGWYPIYIWSDIGWYLSFLAFFGVLIIAPLLTKRIYKARQPKLVALVAIESISAQIMALPLIMYIFGEISLISIVANILIVPLVPLAMLLSFVAGFGGSLVPVFSGWVAWPAKILLTYMLDLINILSRVPNALATQSVSLTALIMIYTLVIVFVIIMARRVRSINATITEKIKEEI